MIYVALLRGINVGGTNRVDMKQLKSVFEEAGMTSVRTYINSGNVIFSSKNRGIAGLTTRLEQAIHQSFGLEIRVTLRDISGMRTIVNSIPRDWTNNQAMRCDVMFLWPAVDKPSVLEQLKYKPEIEEVKYVPGAIIWRIHPKDITRSGVARIVGTPLYKQMTIRNCNTARKVLELMESQGSV
jgi:uncharacterized protein (DUF1697 family)